MTLTYSYLGPPGTFTEQALRLEPKAKGQEWLACRSVLEALQTVLSQEAQAAMIPFENSLEGGVSAAQDALIELDNLQIFSEYLVPVSFCLISPHSWSRLRAMGRVTLAAHPVAYAQCRNWLIENLPEHECLVSASNAQAPKDLDRCQAALTTPALASLNKSIKILAQDLTSHRAMTRFILVGQSAVMPDRTGRDKTSVVADLSGNRPGALLELLTQFATRNISLSLIESRPIGNKLGRYRFMLDLDGHIFDERVSEALSGVYRISPRLRFLGSYPRAQTEVYVGDEPNAKPDPASDAAFIEARGWLQNLKDRK